MKRELRELVKQKEKKETDKYVRENLMKKRESISDSLNLFIYIQELGITAIFVTIFHNILLTALTSNNHN